MVHGDIKPENILITSYNQVFLTDMVPCKRTYFKNDDLKNFNYFMGELDNNRRCYISPERFMKPEEFDRKKAENMPLDPKMDVFSAGCVIAEIFRDGNVLFDRSTLNKYYEDESYPLKETMFENKVKDKAIVDLILSMVSRNAEDRPDIKTCLKRWVSGGAFPPSFSRVFYQLSSSFVRPQYLFSDLKISLLRRFMPSIWRSCFDSKVVPRDVLKMFYEPIERQVFEKLRADDITSVNSALVPACLEDLSEYFNFIDATDNQPLDFECADSDKQSIIVLIHWIGAFISTCYFPQTRRCALEMLLVIGKHSTLDIRLQYVLPYVFKMFEDKQSKVKAKAIEVAVGLFENIIDNQDVEHHLGSTDYKVFDNYIWPQFEKVRKKRDDPLV